MKVIIAGSRSMQQVSYRLIFGAVDACGFDITEVVCGGARGADLAGEQWAETYGCPIEHFPADWNTHGKRAGPIRNAAMADYADALVLVWDGESPGSASMKSEMEKRGKPIFEVVVKQPVREGGQQRERAE